MTMGIQRLKLGIMLIVGVVGVSAGNVAGIYSESTLYDFGDVASTAGHKHSFYIRNDGDARANILSIGSSCGCTVAKPQSNEVPPHGRVEIPIHLDGSGRSGSFSGKVFVQLDLLDQPLEFEIRANFPELENQLEAFPRKIYFTDAVPERRESEFIVIKRENDSSVGKLAVASDNSVIEVMNVDYHKSHDGIEYASARGQVTNAEPGARFSTMITIQGELGERDRVSVEVEGNVVPVNQIYPSALFLNLFGRDRVSQTIIVSNALDKPISIGSVTKHPPDLPGIVTFKRVNDTEWQLLLEVNAESLREATAKGKVTVRLSSSDSSSLEIPVIVIK